MYQNQHEEELLKYKGGSSWRTADNTVGDRTIRRMLLNGLIHELRYEDGKYVSILLM